MNRRNIELKARLADPAAARRRAVALATEHVGVLKQRDTYFHCKSGRLKLRESDEGAQLIWYARGLAFRRFGHLNCSQLPSRPA